jgi:hypothetical protein
MCVFLCANAKVSDWLDAMLVRVDRQSRQQLSVLVSQPPWTPSTPTYGHESANQSVGSSTTIVRETTSRYEQLALRRASPHERHKPLDALADAWSRLLIFVGWRR